jgi:pimeloyl-ACP methyl ester carboxylesterase
MDGTGELLGVQVQQLQDQFELCCLAIPAHDRSDWTTLASQVMALIEERLSFNPNRPVWLCGESFGGCLALQVAQTQPECFQQMILINPASSLRSRPWLTWGSNLMRWLPGQLYLQSAELLLPWLAAIERITEAEKTALLCAMRSVPQPTSIWRLAMLQQFQLPPLHVLDFPVLLVGSVADRLLPSVAEVERLQAQLPKSTVVTLPQSGHACLLEPEVNLAALIAEHCLVPITESSRDASLETR